MLLVSGVSYEDGAVLDCTHIDFRWTMQVLAGGLGYPYGLD